MKVKIITKNIHLEQALKLLKKKMDLCSEDLDSLAKQMKKMENGAFLFRILNTETEVATDYFLNKIYIKKFGLQYGNTKRIGQELMISNFPLPRGKI